MHEHKKWMRFAKGDLEAAKVLLASENDLVVAAILYLCQQCIEKALKSYLAHKKLKIRKTHDLVELLGLCSEFDSSFLIFLSDVGDLNPYVTRARYPDSFPFEPHISLAQWAVKQTTLIFDFVYDRVD